MARKKDGVSMFVHMVYVVDCEDCGAEWRSDHQMEDNVRVEEFAAHLEAEGWAAMKMDKGSNAFWVCVCPDCAGGNGAGVEREGENG